MNHMQFAAAESAALKPTSCESWLRKAETLAGHDLDGDEASGRDRFSLDSAVNAFEAGWSPEKYVAWFRGSKYVAPAKDDWRNPKARFTE